MMGEERQECPECAEQIPVGVVACPLCGADLAWRMRPDEVTDSAQSIRAGLDDYMKFGAYQQEVAAGSSVLSGGSIAWGIVTLGCFVAAVMAGMQNGDDAEGIAVLGVVGGIFCSICTLVYLSRDLGSMGLAKVRKPKTFVRRFMKAALSGREQRAYVATVPTNRVPTTMHEVDLGAIPQHAEVPPIDSLGGFRKYWRQYIRRGPSLQSRGIAIRKVHEPRELAPGLYAVQVDLRVTNYPSLALIGIFVLGLFVAILVLLLQKKHDLTITKTVIFHNGRYFMLEPELVGTWDLAAEQL